MKKEKKTKVTNGPEVKVNVTCSGERYRRKELKLVGACELRLNATCIFNEVLHLKQ